MYYTYLIGKLKQNQKHSLEQKKDLNNILTATTDYNDNIEEWFNSVFELISETKPEYYVKYITVIENEKGEVTKVDYSYCDQKPSIDEDDPLNIIISKQE